MRLNYMSIGSKKKEEKRKEKQVFNPPSLPDIVSHYPGESDTNNGTIRDDSNGNFMPVDKPDIQYKFMEDQFLEELKEYINSTYTQHYIGNRKNIQVMDLLLANEPTGIEFSRGAAVKYIMRYGKKEGRNRKDLLKAMHYIMFMLYSENMGDVNDIK
mgnify:FL=1